MVQNHLLQVMALTGMEPPTSIAAAAPFNVEVTVVDKFGNVATGDTSSVTVALGAHPATAVFTPVTMAVTNGVATFTGLALTPASNTKYTLKFTDSLALPALTSKPITVT
jgi:hypothetical protein